MAATLKSEKLIEETEVPVKVRLLLILPILVGPLPRAVLMVNAPSKPVSQSEAAAAVKFKAPPLVMDKPPVPGPVMVLATTPEKVRLFPRVVTPVIPIVPPTVSLPVMAELVVTLKELRVANPVLANVENLPVPGVTAPMENAVKSPPTPRVVPTVAAPVTPSDARVDAPAFRVPATTVLPVVASTVNLLVLTAMPPFRLLRPEAENVPTTAVAPVMVVGPLMPTVRPVKVNAPVVLPIVLIPVPVPMFTAEAFPVLTFSAPLIVVAPVTSVGPLIPTVPVKFKATAVLLPIFVVPPPVVLMEVLPVTVVEPVRFIVLPLMATVFPELPIMVLPPRLALILVLPEIVLFALLTLTAVPLTFTVVAPRAPTFTVAAAAVPILIIPALVLSIFSKLTAFREVPLAPSKVRTPEALPILVNWVPAALILATPSNVRALAPLPIAVVPGPDVLMKVLPRTVVTPVTLVVPVTLTVAAVLPIFKVSALVVPTLIIPALVLSIFSKLTAFKEVPLAPSKVKTPEALPILVNWVPEALILATPSKVRALAPLPIAVVPGPDVLMKVLPRTVVTPVTFTAAAVLPTFMVAALVVPTLMMPALVLSMFNKLTASREVPLAPSKVKMPVELPIEVGPAPAKVLMVS